MLFGSIQYLCTVKGCDSNYEVKCSNLRSHYKWTYYLSIKQYVLGYAWKWE